MFTNFFRTLGHRFIAGGDWNAKHTHWGSRLTSTRGRQLKICIEEEKLHTLSTSEPTNWPTDKNKRPDLLDFFILKGLCPHYFKVESCHDGNSDHTPVLLTISETVIEVEKGPSIYNHKTDWDSFRDLINEKINLKIRLKTENDIDCAIENLTKTIQDACWNTTPILKNMNSTPNLTLDIKMKILEKRRLRRVWHTSRNSSDKTALNKAIVELKQLIRAADDETLQTKMESLTATKDTNYSLWKFSKNYDRPQVHRPPIKTSNNGWARTSQEKCEIFAEYLSKVFTPNNISHKESEEYVDRVLKEDLQLELPPKPVTPKEVRRIIIRLDSKKAPGYDLITKEVLAELPRNAIVLLTVLYNSMLRLQYFPDAWKVSEIIMIHKNGKPANLLASYRPISLLPTMSKVFEKILLSRISPFLKDRDVIPDHQFGFRERHGTVEQVHRVYEQIRKSLELKEYCSAAFLDIQQAFDKVWHRGLLSKIKQFLPHSYFLLMQSYLKDRLFYVKECGSNSPLYEIYAGVPQGSVLGPVLYTMYTADLPVTPEVTTATFADDTAILSSHKDNVVASEKLQNGLDQIHTWLERWKIKASSTKSVQVTFTLRTGKCPPVKLGSETLPHKDCVKYLGMHLDRRLTWQHHIKAKKEEMSMRHRNLYWMLGRNSKLSLDNKLLLYNMIIKPIWMYGIQLWGSSCNSNIEILQRQQNKILRTVADTPWFIKNAEIHQYLTINSVKEEVKIAAKRYQERLAKHPNKLARQINKRSYSLRLKRKDILELQN